MRLTAALRSMMKGGLAGDQPLHGANFIGKAALNVFEPGGGREIIAVEEKRSHVCHEHISFKQEVVRLCQLRGGGYIQRVNLGDGHASSVITVQLHVNFCALHNACFSNLFFYFRSDLGDIAAATSNGVRTWHSVAQAPDRKEIHGCGTMLPRKSRVRRRATVEPCYVWLPYRELFG
jgi:hypothetical protein